MAKLIKYASIGAVVLGLLVSASTGVLAQTEHEGRHPPAGAAAEAAPAEGTSGAAMSGMMGGAMMGNMMRGGGMMAMMEGCPMMGMMMGRGGAETRAKGRIAFLKAELAITDAQKDVWDAYAAALGKNLDGMQAMRQSMMKMMEAKSPVERLDAHITAMESRAAALKEVKPALSNLYAALTGDQKKAADQLLTGMGCMM